MKKVGCTSILIKACAVDLVLATMPTSSAAIMASPYPLSFTSAFSSYWLWEINIKNWKAHNSQELKKGKIITLNFVFAPQMMNVSLHVWWRWLPRKPPGWICPTCSDKQANAPPNEKMASIMSNQSIQQSYLCSIYNCSFKHIPCNHKQQNIKWVDRSFSQIEYTFPRDNHRKKKLKHTWNSAATGWTLSVFSKFQHMAISW